jgi:hypothetical protein
MQNLPTNREWPEGSRLALCVGIGAYSESSGKWEIPDAALDAKRMKEVLATYGDFKCRSVVDCDSTRLNDELSGFFARAPSGSHLFLFVACHGARAAGAGLTLVAIDGEGVLGEKLVEMMVSSHARNIVVVLDCCFSGIAALEVVRRFPSTLDVDRTLYVLAAARSDEEAEGSLRGGRLTTALIDTFKRSPVNARGHLTVEYAVAEVRDRFRGAAGQSPSAGGVHTTYFPLIWRPPAAAPASGHDAPENAPLPVPEARIARSIGAASMGQTGPVAAVSGSFAPPAAPTAGGRAWRRLAVTTAAAALAGGIGYLVHRTFAIEFTGFEANDSAHWVVPGAGSAELKLLGKNLHHSLETWLPPWCQALRDSGLTDACDTVDVAPDGTSVTVKIVAPYSFERPNLPLPALDGRPRWAAIPLRHRLRFAIVHYGNQSDYLPLIDEIVKRVRAEDERFLFDPKQDIEMFEQDQLLRLLDEVGQGRRWDMIRLPPYAYYRVRESLLADGGGEPIEMLVCGSSASRAMYHSILFARKNSVRPENEARLLSKEEAQALLRAQHEDRKELTIKWGGVFSTSGFVAPCLIWGKFFQGLGVGQANLETTEVVSEVLAPQAHDVRLGFGWDAQVRRVAAKFGHEYDVLWSSDELPLGGIGLLRSVPPQKRKLLRDVTTRLATALGNGEKVLPPLKDADIDSYGLCADHGPLVRQLDSLGPAERALCVRDR